MMKVSLDPAFVAIFGDELQPGTALAITNVSSISLQYARPVYYRGHYLCRANVQGFTTYCYVLYITGFFG